MPESRTKPSSEVHAVLLPWPDRMEVESARAEQLRQEAGDWCRIHGARLVDHLDSNLPLAELVRMIAALPGVVVTFQGIDRTVADALPLRSIGLDAGPMPSAVGLRDQRILRLRRLGMAPRADQQCGDALSLLEGRMRVNLDREYPG